ncbi:hypothetical protein L1987_54558 [Smallanthus sonchifolius]|uniref:Uncharacterized protein n=1 Tax=Smallanthus sonchifolius TaxID=185202 RepID=A0ACB9E845_9ASTR|nr:hypothetical protein L1987_54558 [Smallanthus sonchifolius]
MALFMSDAGILIHHDKYVKDILTKFNMSDCKSASTPIAPHEPLIWDSSSVEVNQKMYRSMICSLMYLTTSRTDIMFAVCSSARYQSAPKESHESDVKRIFRYLKGRVNLSLWYPSDSEFKFYAYTDSDYGGHLRQEIYIRAASSCCSQVIWIQHQLQGFGINFLETPIYCDNEAVLGILKNPIQHSKTKHIAIRHESVEVRARHNFCACLTASTRKSKGYEEIVRFINRSRIHTAISTQVQVFENQIREFWDNVVYRHVNKEIWIESTVGIVMTIGYEGAFLRRQVTKTLLGKQWRRSSTLYCPDLPNDGIELPLEQMQEVIFSSMNNVRKRSKFSGTMTPLFPNMIVEDPNFNIDDEVDDIMDSDVDDGDDDNDDEDGNDDNNDGNVEQVNQQSNVEEPDNVNNQ